MIMIMKTITILLSVMVVKAEPVGRLDLSQNFNDNRRILRGNVVEDTRRYMVYLRPTIQAEPQVTETDWLCSGVIIHERYILTSAACIEDAKNFYVISGTNKWVPFREENDCIKFGAKKAVWKCYSKNYFFDGAEFENIRWMSGDIAVVKVEDDFNFEKRVRGCDYVPSKIPFNNLSLEYEKPGTTGSIAGWGSTQRFGDFDVGRSSSNSPELLETDVRLISKNNCKKRWDPRYHHIIDESMICTKDSEDSDVMSAACIERGVECKELEYSNEYEDEENGAIGGAKTRRLMINPGTLEIHAASHQVLKGSRRANKLVSGGFCENDHGGPLVIGHGSTSMVVGIIAACMTKDITKKCYGPFLYTSVYTNRHLISCAIDKDIGATCRKSFQAANSDILEESFDWNNHRDGPAKSDTSGDTRKSQLKKAKVKLA